MSERMLFVSGRMNRSLVKGATETLKVAHHRGVTVHEA